MNKIIVGDFMHKYKLYFFQLNKVKFEKKYK